MEELRAGFRGEEGERGENEICHVQSANTFVV